MGYLLETSPWNFKVSYAGSEEDIDVTEETLKGVAVHAQPGGPNLKNAWGRTKGYKQAIRSFVSSGGYYMGLCLSAFLAGYSPGFGLLLSAADTDAEISQKNAQVKSEVDTVIQFDWTFVDGHSESAGGSTSKTE